jgi:lipopolysaccharide heptosyltransferase II
LRNFAKPVVGATEERWRAARNVLCVRLDNLGDVLMTSPAIRALKESAGGRRITLLTSGIGEKIARLIPEIDRSIVFQAPWMKATGPLQEEASSLELVERLKQWRFDAAVIFTVYSQSPLPAALLCFLAEIPLRLAYCRENPYQLLTDWVPEREPEQLSRHEVRRQLDLVGSAGALASNDRLSLAVPDDARLRVGEILRAQGVGGSSWLVMHPGASASSRRYPPERFALAADRLAQRGCGIVLTGNASEIELISGIQQRMTEPSLSLAGRLSLAELAALLAAAPLLISNNTGPVHMAAALGTPVVDLYALTNPQHTPWGVESRVLFHDVPCRNCYKSVCPEGHHHCLALVSPEAVVEAAAELLAQQAGLLRLRNAS